MAQCPVCQSEIEITSQHFGTLFTCPRCSAVFFVDWGGQPEVAANSETFGEVPNDQEPAPVYESVPAEEAPATEVAEEPNYDFSQPLGDTAPQPMTPLGSESNPLGDIADFGNADLDQSALNYTITISGIDSGALRTQIQEAISDSKFGWSAVQIIAQIKGGVLTIRSVNAVKASILVQRVKYLPVKISWRQDVLSSSV